MKPYLSIVILNFNRKGDVLELIESLTKQTYQEFEIILVDNASSDGSVAAIREKYPEVRIVALDKNIGRPGHNKGANVARGEVLVFLDADTYFPSDFMGKLASKFKSKPIDATSFHMKHPAKDYAWEPTYAIEGSDEVGYDCTFGGGLWSIRRKVFEDVGGFNPDFFVYVDEWEYLIRLWKRGYSVKFFPDLVGFHKETPYAYRSVMRGYHVIINHAQIYALYLPVKLWPRFLRYHSGVVAKVLVKGEANRWGSLKGILLAGFYFLKALPKRKVLKGEVLEKFLRFYFPKRGDVVVSKWGWTKEDKRIEDGK